MLIKYTYAALVMIQNDLQGRYRQYNSELNKVRMGKELIFVKPVGL